MATWISVVKALPYIAQVVTAAMPAFTAKAAAGKNNELVSTQISELQAESIRSAEHVKTLATQLQETINEIDARGSKLQHELIIVRRLLLFSIVLFVIAISVFALVFLKKAA